MMNANKAREYFSAYYENELSQGLRQQFESALASDPKLQDEFAQFVQAVSLMTEMKDEEIEVPSDLSEIIARKVDKHVYDLRETAKPGIFGQFRLAMLGGIAVVAILATFFAINSQSAGKIGQANLIPSAQSSADLKYDGSTIRLVVTAGEKMSVKVTNAETKALVNETTLDHRNLNSPLTNQQAAPVVLDIDFSNNVQELTVVLPGTAETKVLQGSGTALDFAKAVAQTFRTPVLVRLKDRDAKMDWSFDSGEGINQLPALLKDQPQTLTIRDDRFLVLND